MPPALRPDTWLAALLHTPAAWLYALGYLTGIATFALMARRRGLGTVGIWSVCVVGLIGGLIGANLAQFAATGGTAGKTVLGGVAGGYLAVHLYKRFLGLRRPLGDLFAVGMMAGEAVGRWGCFLGGCCYGREISGMAAWLGVEQHGALRHPTQAYLSLACAAILGVLLVLERRRTLPENGLFFVQGMLYCVARFVIEFFRTADPVLLGLTMAQFACVSGAVFFGFGLRRLLARARTDALVSAPATAAAT